MLENNLREKLKTISNKIESKNHMMKRELNHKFGLFSRLGLWHILQYMNFLLNNIFPGYKIGKKLVFSSGDMFWEKVHEIHHIFLGEYYQIFFMAKMVEMAENDRKYE